MVGGRGGHNCLGDHNVTNKISKLPFLVDRLVWPVGTDPSVYTTLSVEPNCENTILNFILISNLERLLKIQYVLHIRPKN
jgi:hypothetical protein